MVKNSIGNGEAKELIRMTHEHELGPGEGGWEGGTVGGRGREGQRGMKRRKKWDNCNSIIS